MTDNPADPRNLAQLMAYLQDTVAARLSGREAEGAAQVRLHEDGSALMALLERRGPEVHEFLTLVLALAPHLDPGFAARILEAGAPAGLSVDEPSGLCLPTGNSACWLAGAESVGARMEMQALFDPTHWFATEGLLRLEPVAPGLPRLSGRLVMDPDWVDRLVSGRRAVIGFGPDFPAQRVTTRLGWDDLVLPASVKEQIDELEAWQRHQSTLLKDWGMSARLKPGYRALFHGPPGTGKTLTATLLGRALSRDVYRVDLSTVVSKYIGETEKNLARLFARAEQLDAILFFDEADALFGKRTAVKDSHDRYANQEVSYLLQRVEEYDGLVILATNFRANLDDAFLRRFNAIIAFPMPGESDRREIWERCLPNRGERQELARQMAAFELSGGAILNVVQHAAIRAVADGRDAPSLEDAVHGVRREVEKDGKVFRNLLGKGATSAKG